MRPASTCSSSTTPRPTEPARLPIAWRRRGRGCTCCTAPARTASATPIGPASPGGSSTGTPRSPSSMPTSRTRRRSCPACSRRSSAEPTSCSARATRRVGAAMAGRCTAGSPAGSDARSRRAASACPTRISRAASSSGAPSALVAIDVASTRSQGYVFQVETTQRAHRAGLRIVELPFTFRDRTRRPVEDARLDRVRGRAHGRAPAPRRLAASARRVRSPHRRVVRVGDGVEALDRSQLERSTPLVAVSEAAQRRA